MPAGRTTPQDSKHQRTLQVMGCRAHLVVHGGTAGLLDVAEQRLRQLEGLWSRFLPDSDITRANRAAGSPVEVHEDTLAVVRRAVDGWQQTSGRFDITLLPALTAAGYHRSAVDGSEAPVVPGRHHRSCADLRLDYAASTLTVPEGGAIDLGGIGKGFAADLVAEELVEAGAAGALVNLGGDIAVQGHPIDEPLWYLGIEDPRRAPEQLAVVRLVTGGLATSGTTVRRWRTSDGDIAHHLIDPTSGHSADTDVLTASVIAADTATAEVFATAAMLLAPAHAVALLDGVGLAGVVVGNDGVVHRSATFSAYT